MTQQIDNDFRLKLNGIELNEAVIKRLEFVIAEVLMLELEAKLPIGDGGEHVTGLTMVLPSLNIHIPFENGKFNGKLNQPIQIKGVGGDGTKTLPGDAGVTLYFSHSH
jgi:hypothetical protein